MNLSSGYPFSLIKNGLPFDYPKLEKSIKTNVLILGGGISGALVAHSLANNNIDCTVVDARTIGLGSTCASTSLLQYEIDVPLIELKNKIGEKNAIRSYHLCVESIYKLKDIAAKIGHEEFELKKSLYYAAHKKDVIILEGEFKIRKENGFNVNYLEEEVIKKTFGFSSPGAILSDDGAQMNAYIYTHQLHQHNIGMGGRVFDRTPVVHINHEKNKVVLSTEQGYKIEAKKLVYATGYEVVNFIDKKIVDLNSTYAIASEQYPKERMFWKDDVMIWNTANPYLYIRTTTDKRIIVGGRDEKFFNPTQRDKLLKKKSKQLTQDFKKIFPQVNFKPEFSWCGVFGATKDGLPYIGQYHKLSNSYFALGFGGNGITFSLIAAEIITDQILGKKNKDMNLFSFTRI